jgi:hypothetical protein
MIGGPVVDELSQSLGPGEDDPARAAGERLAHRGELGAPGGERAEVALDRRGEVARGIAAGAAERVEIDFVQDDRAGGDQLLALEAVQLEDRCVRDVERGKAPPDRVEAPQRAAIIVLVVAREEAFGEAVEPRRLERQWHDGVLAERRPVHWPLLFRHQA